MLTNTQTQTNQLTKVGTAILENPNGTSHRLVWYHFDANGQPQAWNPVRDLSLLDLTQAGAGLEAIAKMVAGGLAGSPTLAITTPTAKLAYEAGTGTFGYLWYDHQGDLTVNVNGTDLLVHVEDSDIPAHHVARVYLDAGQLYRKAWEQIFTPSDVNSWPYWYARALRAILEGRNLSVSIGPRMLVRAQEVEAVIKADDPVAANAQRQYVGRNVARLNREVAAERTVMAETAAITGQPAVANPADMVIPVFGTNTTLDLATWPSTQLLRLCNANGLTLRPVSLKDGSPESRIALAKSINKSGFAFDPR